MAQPHDLVDIGLREALRLTLLDVAVSPQIDGAGCLLLDGSAALRYAAATNVPARALEVAEELCAEGPCHEAFAQGSVDYEDVLHEPRWELLSTLLAMSPVRSVLGEPIPVHGASLGALDAFAAVPQHWHADTVAALRRHAVRLGELIEEALAERLDQQGDALTAQAREALASREILHAAQQVVRSDGGDQHAAVLQLQQLGVTTGVGALDLARQVVRLGRLPDAGQLRQQVLAADQRSAAVERMAWTDPLTGLVNRARFFDRLEQAMRRADRLVSPPAVVFLDLDGFKEVNDTYGHDVGDAVLRGTARRLLETVRGHDTVCRLGGDEFAVLSEQTDEPQAAAKLAARLEQALAVPFPVTPPDDGVTPGVQVRASIGIAVAARDQQPADLLRQADTAMYVSKRAGRGQIRVYDEEMGARDRRRSTLESSLRAQLAPQDGPLHGIWLAYQPIVRLTTQRAESVEALVRWSHPELGEVSADELIDLAETTGLIVPLGERLLLEACRAAARWRRLPGGEAVNVAVNVSALQLADDGFVAAVEGALADSGLSAEQLCLELTETRLLTAGPQVADVIARLGNLGINLALDDFGTGYSSLAHLADLPVQVLKVDRGFVAGLDADDSTRGVVARAVVGLASALGMDTVAEGVETSAQAEAARAIGGTYAQGYYFSRPVPETELPPLLTAPLGGR